LPRDSTTRPSSPIVHSSKPEIRTHFPVPPGPVFVRVNVVVLDRLVVEDDVVHEHLYVRERVDERTRDLGDLGGISTVDSDPPGTKWSATFVGSWLHQASV
jgi:hypothetical protein